MEIGAHTIKPGNRRNLHSKRVGRGNGSGKGTYSARGLKGQKSRSGGRGGLQRRAFKQSLQKVPKLRGFKSSAVRPESVTLSMLERVFDAGAEVTPFILKEKGLISNARKGAKIVASGTLSKKIAVSGCTFSVKAAEMIEKAGGSLAR